MLLGFLAWNIPLWSGPAQLGSGESENEIFIGQGYPSGNVYLKSIVGARRDESDKWPTELLLVPLVIDKSVLVDDLLKAVRTREPARSGYLPGFERMEDQHALCSDGQPYTKEPKFRYLSRDFFDALSDHCEGNDDVAVYRASSSSPYSFMVLGLTARLSVTAFRPTTGLRPATNVEQQEIARQKKELDNNSPQLACTTVPAFIDSASVFAEVTFGNGALLRVSSYEDPGCSGHLSQIYVFDILTGNSTASTFRLIQSRGLL
jgi:hypothetical protein